MVILGVLAKIFTFYHLETFVLASVIAIILWTYRLTFKGEVKYDDVTVLAKCRLNVFNHKTVKVCFVSKNTSSTLKVSGKKVISSFQVADLPYIAKVTQDNLDLRKFVLTLNTSS
jgi:hypothetical protein